MLRSIVEHARLTAQLAQREIAGRYQGSVFGLAWSFLNPLLMLAVYTWIFAGVFKARWGATPSEDHGDFAIVLFAGLIVHALFAECVNRAPSLMLANANFIKKVVFPLEVLPIAALASSVFHACISLLILLAGELLIRGAIPWTAVLAPLILAPFVFFTLGVAWFLAALGVYLRDIGQITGVFTTMLMFLSPIFYPVSAAPEQLQFFLYLNPLTYVIEWLRGAMIMGHTPDWSMLAFAYVMGSMAAWFGFWWFQKVRKGFADVV